jgi:hypothetical protein
MNGCAVYPPSFLTGTGNGIVRMFPAHCRLQLPSGSNPTIQQVSPQAYKVVLSLSGTNTVQLNPAYANGQQTPTAQISPASPVFTFTTRQEFVATVSESGLITAQGRGECVILVGAVRAICAPFAGATNPSGNTGNEIYLELAVRVIG